MAPQAQSLQFGIEIELLLQGRKQAYTSWKSLANEVSKRLAAAGISNHIDEGSDKSVEHYREWSIVREVTIPNEPAKGRWGIELVSPVYAAAWYWAADMENIFTTLKQFCVIHSSSHCSTHIHISGTPLPLSSIELSALAKAALYFEPALDDLVPAERRGSDTYWCKSNRANKSLKGLGLGDCLGIIERAAPCCCDTHSSMGSSDPSGKKPDSGRLYYEMGQPAVPDEQAATRAVISTMNLFPADSTYGKCHKKKHDFIRGKVYKWDFSGMLPPSRGNTSTSCGKDGVGMPVPAPARGTVEFRQPPGSKSAEDAKGWISLVLAFVTGVVAASPAWPGVPCGALADDGASLEELWGLLVSGAARLGWEGVGPAARIFTRRRSAA